MNLADAPLAARYIATQPDPEYIDLVMAHLHEAWWQEVHLLTIAHLGSGNAGASKASNLILMILHVYAPPSWILRSSRNRWLLLIGPRQLLPQVQLERRIAWILAREFELAIKGYAECVPDGTTATVSTVLSAQAASLVRHIIYDGDHYKYKEQEALITVTFQSLQRQGKEVVVSALLEALHDADRDVRWRAAASLGQVGVGNEAVAGALLEALHDTDEVVRRYAAASLGQVGVGNEAVAGALLEALHDASWDVRMRAAAILGQVGVGNEAVAGTLLAALHDTDWHIQEKAAASLGQVGVGNEAVVSALLEALHNTDEVVRRYAAASLGRLEIKDPIQLRRVLSALNRCLHSWENSPDALVSIRQLLDGRPIPGYRWVALRKRRAQLLRLKRVAFWLGMTAVMVLIGLVITLLLGTLDPNGFAVRFLAVLAGIVAFVAAVAQVLGRTLRDPWEQS